MTATKIFAFLAVMVPLSMMAQEREFINDAEAKAYAAKLVVSASNARLEYQKDLNAMKQEDARVRYVTALTNVAYDYIDIGKGPAWEYLETGWEALNAEIDRYPAPADSDSKTLSRLMVGKWGTPRRDFIFRKNGTSTILPVAEDDASDHWWIKGNKYDDSNEIFTIFLLTKKYFVYSDEVNGKGVIFMRRLTK
jgi:hypothetical protein